MDQASSRVRLVEQDWLATGLVVMAAGLWAVVLVGVVLSPTRASRDPFLLWLFGGMAALMTVALAARLLHRWRIVRRLVAHGVTVSGRVLRVHANAENIWVVLIGYALEGREYQTRSVTGVRPSYEVEDPVLVRVDPAKPSRAMIQEEEPERA